MSRYEERCEELQARPRRWLVTGVAGFIGSNLLLRLLELGQTVVGVDNFSTGKRANLELVRDQLQSPAWTRFIFNEGDIRDLETCRRSCAGVDIVLHQAALGSVPRSLQDPIASHQSNVDGFLNMLVAAREDGNARMVFASSSSVYGDDPNLPKVEAYTGNPLSPYALTKVIDESYAEIFRRAYDFKCIGLRYFNVFGPNQNPSGPYAAVIPRWFETMLQGEVCLIHGDGETSRDFCYVANVVQANILAGTAPEASLGEMFNVSFGGTTTLTRLHGMIRERLLVARPGLALGEATYTPVRPGDVRHSQADLTKIKAHLGYQPTHDIEQGLDELARWYTRS